MTQLILISYYHSNPVHEKRRKSEERREGGRSGRGLKKKMKKKEWKIKEEENLEDLPCHLKGFGLSLSSKPS